MHDYVDNRFLSIGYRYARSRTFLGGLGIDLTDHKAVVQASINYVNTQSFAHMLRSKLEADEVCHHHKYNTYSLLTPLIKNPVVGHFDPQLALKTKGKGWSLVSSNASEVSPENELTQGTVLHFAHPALIEVAIEMLMVFPQNIIAPLIRRKKGIRNINVVVAPTLVVRYSISVIDPCYNILCDYS